MPSPRAKQQRRKRRGARNPCNARVFAELARRSAGSPAGANRLRAGSTFSRPCKSPLPVDSCDVPGSPAGAKPPKSRFTARLTASGDDPPIMPVASDATEPTEPLTPALHVAVPNAQAPRIMTLISPAIAIPFNSRIRQIQAFWNATSLPLIDPRGTQLTEEAH